MMTVSEKNDSLLKAFGIPAGEGEQVAAIRGILSRLMASRALRLADLQTARDIVERARVGNPEAYLFLAAMFVSAGKGNAFMRDENVADLLVSGGRLDDSEKLGFPVANDDYGQAVRTLCAPLAVAGWKDALKGDVLVVENGRWFFQRNHRAVGDLNQILRDFSKGECLQDIDGEVLEKAATFAKFKLNGDKDKDHQEVWGQKAALAAAATQRFTVIVGGPGTGKTTTVCAILRALLSLNPQWTERDIALAAPTGRAAQRMQEAILDQCEGIGRTRES